MVMKPADVAASGCSLSSQARSSCGRPSFRTGKSPIRSTKPSSSSSLHPRFLASHDATVALKGGCFLGCGSFRETALLAKDPLLLLGPRLSAVGSLIFRRFRHVRQTPGTTLPIHAIFLHS